MDRLLIVLVTGLKVALLAQAPLLLLALGIGLSCGGAGIEPGFEAVGRLLWIYGLLFGPPLALLGFVCGMLPGASVIE